MDSTMNASESMDLSMYGDLLLKYLIVWPLLR